jgi:hypothetical protein
MQGRTNLRAVSTFANTASQLARTIAGIAVEEIPLIATLSDCCVDLPQPLKRHRENLGLPSVLALELLRIRLPTSMVLESSIQKPLTARPSLKS